MIHRPSPGNNGSPREDLLLRAEKHARYLTGADAGGIMEAGREYRFTRMRTKAFAAVGPPLRFSCRSRTVRQLIRLQFRSRIRGGSRRRFRPAPPRGTGGSKQWTYRLSLPGILNSTRDERGERYAGRKLQDAGRPDEPRKGWLTHLYIYGRQLPDEGTFADNYSEQE